MRKRSETIALKRYIILGALVVLVMLLAYTGFVLVPQWQFNRAAPVALTAAPDMPRAAFGDGFVFAAGDQVIGINGRAKQVFAYPASEVKFFSAYGDRLALASSKQVFMLSKTGKLTLAPRDFSEPIQSIRLGKKYITVLTKDESQRNKLTILDYYGALLDEIVLPGQSVMEFGFLSDGAKLWVLSLDSSGAAPTSKCSIYVPREENSTVISVSDQVLYRTITDDKVLYMVGTSSLLCYNDVNELKFSKTVYGWRVLPDGLGTKNVLLADLNVDADPQGQPLRRGRIVELKSASASDTDFIFPAGTMHALLTEDSIIAATGDTVYNLSFNGVQKRKKASMIPIDGIELAGNAKSLLVISGDKLYLQPLP